MATYLSTHSVTYQNGTLTNAGPNLIVSSLNDGEANGTFELTPTADTSTYPAPAGTFGYTYAGTAQVDGNTYPAFSFDDDPTFVIVFMPVAPVSPPNTLVLTPETFTVCFAAGTAIATSGADCPVEKLQVGDLVATEAGDLVAVKWIGRQTVLTRFGPAERLRPVRVRAGALGDGLPLRDLTLTADHALLIDGLLINAGALVNGDGVDHVPLSELGGSYTVYHVETEAHDVILAEGTPAETYIDYAARSTFDNYAEYVALYGEDRTIPEMAYPRISSARMLPQVLRARLEAQRAA